MKNKRELDDLAIEISELCEEIEKKKSKNKKRRLEYNLKKLKHFAKIGAIFSIVPLGGTLISCAMGWNPFKLNDVEIPETSIMTVDRDGNTSVEQSYLEDSKDEDQYLLINYYTKWDETKSGNYCRMKYTYELALDSDIMNLVDLIQSGQEVNRDKIEALVENNLKRSGGLKKYSSSVREYVPSLDENEENKNYFEIEKRKINSGSYIIEKETIGAHMSIEIQKLFLEALFMFFEYGFLYECTYILDDFDNYKPVYDNIYRLQRELNAKQRLFNKYQYVFLENDSDFSFLDEDETDTSKQYQKQRLQ